MHAAATHRRDMGVRRRRRLKDLLKRVSALAVRSNWMLVVSLSLAASTADAGDVRFRRDVLPILAENCFACHGFDKHARQAELRLDERAGATAKLPSGEHAIAPKEPDKSELIHRINSSDA